MNTGNQNAKTEAANSELNISTGSRWVVKNRNNDQIMRGPYDQSETASAVRSEMENQEIYDHMNLWISPSENIEIGQSDELK